MANEHYHYTESGLDNIYLMNGFRFIDTPRGKAVSFHDADGLHKAIGLALVHSKKDLSGKEVRFLRQEMLMSQYTLGQLLGLSERAMSRWESGKTVNVPKPSESLLRLLYQEHVSDRSGKIVAILKRIAELEEEINEGPILFKDTAKGWSAA